ncbi:peptidylprolyl isomerase [Roseospirillum parvum]|uniref:Parvulin-like PPIase n=1 Tax=Roseospirillum parvum TaxID=83401 RepID=A0A1G8B5Q4_9PROT|nr:peptidylprolyl isomerase [Roseospirillum parvum]SDH28474.1 peptidyl-prolyl cis-trans isomerase D [Roseospirillum parvum]
MLNILRRHTGSWIVKALLGLLILSFAAWGVGDMIRGAAGDRAAIVVGDEHIGPETLRRHFTDDLERLQAMLGGAIDRDTAIRMGLLDATIRRLARQTLLDIEVADNRLVISDPALKAHVAGNPAFQANGQFSRQVFEQTLAANRLNERAYLAGERAVMARQRLEQAVMAGAAAPEVLLTALADYRDEQRRITLLTIDPAALPAPPEPDEEALRAFHAAGQDGYLAPERRSLTYAVLNPEGLAPMMALEEGAVESAYEQRLEQFTSPSSWDLEQILVDSEETAAQVLAARREGRTLAAAAQAAGAPAPVRLEAVGATELPPTLTLALRNQPEGAVIGPVESPLGWHVAEIVGLTEGTVQPLEEVREQLTETLKVERAIERIYEYAAQVEDALAGGATLEEALADLDLETHSLTQVARDGGLADGTRAEDLPPTLLSRAFELPADAEPRMVETETGYLALRLDQVTEARPLTFEEARDRVLADWRREQRLEAADALLAELEKRAGEGADLATLAAETPAASLSEPPPFTRGATLRNGQGPLPQALVGPLFKAEPGALVSGAGPNRRLLARLDEVIVPPARVDDLAPTVTEALAGDLLDQYATALARRHGIQVNQRLIQEMM